MATPPLLVAPPGGIYYHYTTRAAAQEMSMAGQTLPGRSGLIYLTDVLYRLGWQATDRLALPEKGAEVAIPIPAEYAQDVRYLGMVAEWPSGNGHSYRRGGGHQWVVSHPIPLAVFPWSWIALEVP